jgi:hypothetical protein
MLSVSIMDAPIRIGSVGRRTFNRGIVFVLPFGCGTIATACDSSVF